MTTLTAAPARVRALADTTANRWQTGWQTIRPWLIAVRTAWRWPTEHRWRWLVLRTATALMLAPAVSRALAPAAGALLAAPGVRGLGWHWPTAGHLPAVLLAVPAAPVAGRWAVWQLAEWVRNARWYLTVVRPLADPLATLLGTEHWRPRAYVHVPRSIDWAPGVRVRIDVPRWAPMMEDRRKAVEAIVSSRLELRDVSASWRFRGRHPHVLIGVVAQPPRMFGYHDALPYFLAASDTAPVIGMGRSSRVLTADFAAADPHLLLSMSTGAGKSTLLTAVIVQQVARGNLAIVCDVKRSMAWLRRIGNTAYLTRPEQIHSALAAISAEGERRYSLLDECDGYPDAEESVMAQWERVIFVIDELNTTMRQLTQWWASVRGPGDPKVSPAVGWLSDALLMGRGAKIHVVTAAQLATVRSMAGLSELREQFHTRVIGKASAAAWKMLAPEHRVPSSPPYAGRVHVVSGSQLDPCQVAFLTATQAIEYAHRGEHLWRVPAGTRPDAESLFIPGARRASIIADPEPLPDLATGIGLSAAILPGGPLHGLSLTAARRARNRPGFPPPIAQEGTEFLYELAALTAWAAGRRGQPSINAGGSDVQE